MSFALVVVAAIALVIGLLQSGLTIIYVSIGCSLVAGIVLVIAVMRGRPDARPAKAPAARPAAAPPPPPAPSTADQTVVSSAPPPPPPPREREPAAAEAASGSGGVAVSDRTESLDQAEIDEAVSLGGEDDFPIHDYDKLRATEVLPMLAELEEDQLVAVRDREQAGKNRFMILTRIEDELQARRGEGWDAEDEGWSGAEAEAEPAEPAAPAGPARAVPPPSDGSFPIPDYENLRALEVLARLSDLSVAELTMVRRREESGARRAMILNRIDRLQEEAVDSEPEALVVPPSTRSRATGPRAKKSAAATKAAKASKAPARTPKAASKKVTAKAAKAPAKARGAKVPAGKVPAKKAPAAAKGRAAKAPVGKAPGAKKAPAKRAVKRR